MTAPRRADCFQVGDRVRVKPKYGGGGRGGLVTDSCDGAPRPIEVLVDGMGHFWYKSHELELLDAQKVDGPVPADPAMPADPSRQAAGDGRGAGTGVAYPEQAEAFVRWDVATLREQAEAIADLRSQVYSLRRRVTDLESGRHAGPA